MTYRLASSILLCALAWCQLTSQIGGTISDSSGGVIPSAAIELTNQDTGVKWEAASDASGRYIIPLLQPGNYRIRAAAN
ncbi:MAG: carboxypeptidase regulatory-like domain-containing protein [Acidobacteria bacterium]|nr:carboxypeptidase regulatory-like domain-containing protein [Acidobacteriota bacterium]